MKKSKLKTRLKCSNLLLKNCGEQNAITANVNIALRRELADLRAAANGAIERNVELQKELTYLRGHYATSRKLVEDGEVRNKELQTQLTVAKDGMKALKEHVGQVCAQLERLENAVLDAKVCSMEGM